MSHSIDPQTATPLPGAAKPRVLIVEDEPNVRALARMMLEWAGFAVEDAGSAADALARVQSAPTLFAVVLLDYTLPDRSGMAIVPELRLLTPQSRIVLMSGRAEEDMPNHGADGYLAKPFSKEQIANAVRAVATAIPK